MAGRIKEYTDVMMDLFPEVLNKDYNGIAGRNITLCVTSDCQLRCTYCYERHKGTDYMTFDTAKKYIDMIIDGSKGMDKYINEKYHKFIVLEFIGGEPFLAVDLIDQVCDYWVDRLTDLNHPWLTRFRISICSNGVNYFDKRIQDFIRKWGLLLSLSITLDGNEELHNACRHYKGTTIGCYDVAHAACQDLMNRGVELGSKMTYAPENIPYMYDAMIAMIDDGYTDISSNCAYEPEYTIEDAKLFYEQGKKIADECLRRNLDLEDEYHIAIFDNTYFRPKDDNDNQNWCGGTGSMIACDYDGNIYPCIRYMSMSLGDDQPPLIIGNVDDGMLVTPEQQKIIEDMKKIDRRTQSTDECYYCPIAEGCAWCSAWNYQLYGTADKRCTRICPMHKARALFNYYYWNKYYKTHNINKRMKIFIPKEWALEIISPEEWEMLLDLEKE